MLHPVPFKEQNGFTYCDRYYDAIDWVVVRLANHVYDEEMDYYFLYREYKEEHLQDCVNAIKAQVQAVPTPAAWRYFRLVTQTYWAVAESLDELEEMRDIARRKVDEEVAEETLEHYDERVVASKQVEYAEEWVGDVEGRIVELERERAEA